MIEEWDQKEWLQKRRSLQDRINSIAGFKNATVKRYDDKILIEGGSIPVGFGDDGRVYVWSRGSRYAGRRVYLEELTVVKEIIDTWIKEEMQGKC